MFLYVLESLVWVQRKEMDELGPLDESVTLSAFGTPLKASGLSCVKAHGKPFNTAIHISVLSGLFARSQQKELFIMSSLEQGTYIFRKSPLPNRGIAA